MRRIIFRFLGSNKPLNMELIKPDILTNLSLNEIKKLKLKVGRRLLPILKFFKIDEEEKTKPDMGINDCEVIIEESEYSLKYLGCEMKFGKLIVHGNAGFHIGAKMENGIITVNGNVSSWCGAELKGGIIEVKGDTGDFLGGNYIGNKTGMRGGIIKVQGSCGNFAGYKMGGGEITINGSCGDFLGYYMQGGKILVKGKCGKNFGARMTKGIIELLTHHDEITLGFKQVDKYSDLNYPSKKVKIYEGDLTEKGKGIIIIHN
ncbi:MAG: formylmethanofuran dehydrogenase subunit C [Candidatus Odinarchaeia archaeon]